jgi:cobalt-zinc-cadmium efflux system protein
MDAQPRAATRARLRAVMWIGFAVAAGEAVAGVLTGSLALFTDAFHALTHAVAAGIAYGAAALAARPAAPERTYRNWRLEVLAALLNGLLMVPLVAWILHEAWQRFRAPHEIATGPMLAVGAIGLVANLVCAAILHGRSREDLNVRSTFLHMLADAATSVAVLGAGVAILAGAPAAVDPAVAALISLLLLRWAFLMVRDAARILLEAAPGHLDLESLRCDIAAFDGIREVHDLHVWTITSRMHALTAHVRLAQDRPVSQTDALAQKIALLLREKYDVGHVTLQFEVAPDGCEPAHIPRTGPIPAPEPHDHPHA